MKVKIGTRIGEITPEYFSKFGKNFNKFARALGIMFPQSTEEIAKDVWNQMGGVEIIEKPILEPSVEVSEQEVVVDTKETIEVVKTPLKQSKSKAKRYSK
jgi:DNA-binding ferritin-like protein (Dps family)